MNGLTLIIVLAMSRISNTDWQRYKNLMDVNMHEDMGQHPIKWLQYGEPFKNDRWAEGKIKPQYSVTDIVGLIYFNDFRKWPSDDEKTTGKSDSQTAFIYLNKNYLEENNWLNDNGYFAYNPGGDLFVIDGIVVKPFGDTQVAQTRDATLWMTITVRRVSPPTGAIFHNTDTGSIEHIDFLT